MDIVWCVFALLWSVRQCFRVIWSISCTVIRKGVLALYNIPFCLRRCFATTMAIPGRKMCSYMAAAWRRPFSNLTSTHHPLTCRRTVDIGWSHVSTHTHTYIFTYAGFILQTWWHWTEAIYFKFCTPWQKGVFFMLSGEAVQFKVRVPFIFPLGIEKKEEILKKSWRNISSRFRVKV